MVRGSRLLPDLLGGGVDERRAGLLDLRGALVRVLPENIGTAQDGLPGLCPPRGGFLLDLPDELDDPSSPARRARGVASRVGE